METNTCNSFLWQRNVIDEYKPLSDEEIKAKLQVNSLPFAVLMGQIEHDFNIGSVIRAANSFGASKIFYYGKKHFDRRGCLGTYKYSTVEYLSSFDQVKALKDDYTFVGLENNNPKTQKIISYIWSPKPLIIIGEEGNGIQPELLELCDSLVEIPSRGSVRSLNAAQAAAIAMFDYTMKVENI